MHLLVLRLKKYGALDACLFVAALALFAVNEHLIKPAVLGAASASGSLAEGGSAAGFSFAELIILGHFNDFLGGLAFMAYTNLLISLVEPRFRIRNPFIGVAYIFCCGLFWEYAAPLFVPDSVSDPWDVLAYSLGSVAYWVVRTVGSRRRHAGGAGTIDT
ncbi:hypothetical protein [Slackia equolifaciens]|nr:hypothetical protein [Slackia equolifaciens]